MDGGATDGGPKKSETYKDEDGNLVIIPFTSDSPESPLYNKLVKWTGIHSPQQVVEKNNNRM